MAKREGLKAFLTRKDIVFSVDHLVYKPFAAMAQGLFASLLAGLILKTLGEQLHWQFLITVGAFAMGFMGSAIGVSVALSLKAPPIVICASVVTGAAGASLGGPAGALVAAVIGTEFGKLISKETKLDILLTPMVTLLSGYVAGYFIGPYIATFMEWLGAAIMLATTQRPLIMGIVVATLVGLALTGPISSAALCIMLDLSGLAAGAATVGGCAQMIGFAVMSFPANGWGGIFAQGLGTSKIQLPNVIRHPWILVPPTLAGMITGPLSITVWKMENIAVGAGMGTSGLVGQISTLVAMGGGGKVWLAILLLHFLLPAALTLLFALILKRLGKIKDDYLKLEL